MLTAAFNTSERGFQWYFVFFASFRFMLFNKKLAILHKRRRITRFNNKKLLKKLTKVALTRINHSIEAVRSCNHWQYNKEFKKRQIFFIDFSVVRLYYSPLLALLFYSIYWIFKNFKKKYSYCVQLNYCFLLLLVSKFSQKNRANQNCKLSADKNCRCFDYSSIRNRMAWRW